MSKPISQIIMKQKKPLYLLKLLFLVCICLSQMMVCGQTYNIVWITCEDMSPRLGCYGDNTVPTPNIDRLAAEGVLYNQAFASYGVCAPSRHTLITGMYPTSTGAMAMRTWKRTSALDKITDPALLAIPTYEATPPAGVKCFSEYFRAAGYYCTNNKKTDYQFRDPVTAWDESSATAHWRNRPTAEMPFFAIFNNTITHESGTFKPRSKSVCDPASIHIPPYYLDIPSVRQDMARQYDNIAAMDQWVGGILAQLEEDGLLDKTIVIFFSDHGDGLPRAKRWVYDSGIRVPMIIRWPHKKLGGTVNNELVSFVDFAPSMLSLAGLAIPDYMEGQAFLGAEKKEPRKYIYAFRDRMDPAPENIRAVRDKQFKYVRNYRPELPYIGYIPYRDQAAMMQDILKLKESNELGPDQWQFWAQSKPLEELYDLNQDPHEINNLASDPTYFPKLLELRQAHEAWTAKYGDLGQMPETALIKKLWPPDGKQPVTAAPVFKIQNEMASISCATEGSSIAYRLDGRGLWQLYTQPFETRQATVIEAQAIRLGWKKSGITSYRLSGGK